MQVKLKGLKLSAVASALPKNELKISDLYEQFGKKEVERIVQSTGIQSLRIAEEGLTTSSSF